MTTTAAFETYLQIIEQRKQAENYLSDLNRQRQEIRKALISDTAGVECDDLDQIRSEADYVRGSIAALVVSEVNAFRNAMKEKEANA